MTFDLLIMFTNERMEIIRGVTEYGTMNEDFPLFYFVKNDYHTFLPKENVKWFGRYCDWKEGKSV